MSRIRLFHALGVSGALLLVYACGSRSVPSTPPAPQPAASFATSGPTALLGLSSGPVGYRSATDPALEAWKAREKARVERERELATAAFDSLTTHRRIRARPATALLSCDPLPYAASVKVIGPKGGELRVGPHSIRIPRGALTQHYVITAELPVSEAVSVRLSPHGLQFVQMPVLSLSYSHCHRPNDREERVAYTDEFLRVREYPRSEDRKHAVVAWLEHFSRYALAH